MKRTVKKEDVLIKTALLKGDTVRIMTGKEKGKEGKILHIFRKDASVSVERLNLVKRSTKPSQKNPKGGFIEKEGRLAISNVMIVCQKCDRPVRSGVKLLPDGKKLRICRRCEEVLDKVS